MNIDYAEIGRRIAKRRRELGLKQSQVCELCELSDKYLSGIERARSIPSIDVLLRICHTLNTTPNSILLGVADYEEPSNKSSIIERINGMNAQQVSLLASFIDWLEQHPL